MNVVEHAMELAKMYPVFPCAASKKPACPHGFKDASREPNGIKALWDRHGGPLIGIPTGAVSGIDALDIDPRHDGHIWLAEAEDSLPLTQINHTRSGGFHYLFRHAAGVKNTASKIAPGVDTRGDGGYIIWWPAHGCDQLGRDIENWPKWLLSILVPKPEKKYTNHKPTTKAEADVRAIIMIERAYQRVKEASPGQRHFQLRAAAATLGGLMRFMGKSQDQVERELVELIMDAGGVDRGNAEKTVQWAINKGSASPLLSRAT